MASCLVKSGKGGGGGGCVGIVMGGGMFAAARRRDCARDFDAARGETSVRGEG